MSRIFITTTYKNAENKVEIEHLCSLIRQAGFEDFCFVRDVEHYTHIFTDPHELMQRAFEEIRKSDWLLIDVTNKPTGRAIEAGMAFALKKKIVVIMKKGINIKDSVRGIADKIIEYDLLDEITPHLQILKFTEEI